MVNIETKPVQRIIVQTGRTVVVQTKPSANPIRVVQVVSPIPMASGDVADPGDLTLIFANKLI